MHKILLNFEMQTDHQIPIRRQDLDVINKKKRTYRIVDFAVPVDHQVKINKKIEKMKKETSTK